MPMNRSDSARFPVTVTRLPVTRCEICGRTLAYRPGQASTVLTQHYNRMHPEVLVGTPDTARWSAASFAAVAPSGHVQVRRARCGSHEIRYVHDPIRPA